MDNTSAVPALVLSMALASYTNSFSENGIEEQNRDDDDLTAAGTLYIAGKFCSALDMLFDTL